MTPDISASIEVEYCLMLRWGSVAGGERRKGCVGDGNGREAALNGATESCGTSKLAKEDTRLQAIAGMGPRGHGNEKAFVGR